jgi:hypothetical protein
MTDVAVLLGAEREIATEELWLCIEFEKKLANVCLTFLLLYYCVRLILFIALKHLILKETHKRLFNIFLLYNWVCSILLIALKLFKT